MIPPGYVRRTFGPVGALVLEEAAEWLSEALATSSSIYAWAAGREDATALRGRGAVRVVEAPLAGPEARARWAVRHYRRGGLLAPLLDDRYAVAGRTRPEREVEAGAAARARGVRTPAAVAGAWYRSGPFYTADLVTELVPDSVDLAALLFGDAPDAERLPALAAAGRLAHRLGDAGLAHRDLNAMNVLIRGTGSALEAHVVDLDRARLRAPGRPGRGRPMLRRLERSLRKLGAISGRPLSPDEWTALRSGFGGDA